MSSAAVTAITDVVLALEAMLLGLVLMRLACAHFSALWHWRFALAAMGLGALIGAIHHGWFPPPSVLGYWMERVDWIVLGAMTYFFLLAAAAAGATHLLENAKLYDSVREAISDLNFVYATTARGRGFFGSVDMRCGMFVTTGANSTPILSGRACCFDQAGRRVLPFTFFAGFAGPALLTATASRMSALKAESSTASPS